MIAENSSLPKFELSDADGNIVKSSDLKGKKVVIIGDILHSRVALSNIYALQLLGAKVKVCGPPSLIPKHMETLGVEVEHNLKKALQCVTLQIYCVYNTSVWM